MCTVSTLMPRHFVFIIVCGLLVEVANFIESRGQSRDRLLHFWVWNSMGIQGGVVGLRCFSIWQSQNAVGHYGMDSCETLDNPRYFGDQGLERLVGDYYDNLL